MNVSANSVFIIWFVCTTLPQEKSANNFKPTQTMWKWCGVRIAELLYLAKRAIQFTAKDGSELYRKTVSAHTEKGKTMVSQQVLNDLFGAFPDAIMNRNLEFVADPNRRVNSYFRLDNCESREDVTCKVLEYLSREAFKSQHFDAEWRNRQVHDYHHQGINRFCGTNFTKEDIEVIYTYLGNECNRKKTLDFIHSGFDMAVLERRERENEY